MAPSADQGPQIFLPRCTQFKYVLPMWALCLIVATVQFVAQSGNSTTNKQIEISYSNFEKIISPEIKHMNSQQQSALNGTSAQSCYAAHSHNPVGSKSLFKNSSLHERKPSGDPSPSAPRVKSVSSPCRTNSKWTVKIRGGSRDANEIAESLGCRNLGLVRGFSQMYLFEERCPRESASAHSPRAKRGDFVETTDLLKLHKNVVWAEQQTILTRVKRWSPPAEISHSHPGDGAKSQDRAAPVRQPRSSILGSPPQPAHSSQQPARSSQQRPALPLPAIAAVVYGEGASMAGGAHVKPVGRPLQRPQFDSQLSMSAMATAANGNANSGHSGPSAGRIAQSAQPPQPFQQPAVQPMVQPAVQPVVQPMAQAASSSGRMMGVNWQLVLGTSGAALTRPARPAVPNGAAQPQRVSPVGQQHHQQTHLSVGHSTGSQGVGQKVTGTNGSSGAPGGAGVHKSGTVSTNNNKAAIDAAATTTPARNYDDELWTHQWYLQERAPGAPVDQNLVSLHVQDVWRMGFTGKNVVVTVIDDGLEWNHTDLVANYDSMASYDYNNNRPSPYPRYDSLNKQNHGTRCAGEIAMQANNKKCGIGVAPNAQIGAIKILDGEIDEHIEAMSLIHNLHHIDIYSASWGPNDDGMTVEGPKLTQAQALRDGIERGRRGLGAIYIWASGNGGKDGDNCNCDGYVSSLYTIAIGSATERGHFPYFGERCASMMAVTCSSGTLTDKKVTTTDLHNRCTTNFVGTSAAAPLAAGLMALVLEANPNITWRDAQHLVAWNCDYYPLRDNTGWFRNSAGLMFNNKFGFGLMNGKLLVESALAWQNVAPKGICTIPITADSDLLPESISTGAPAVQVQFHTDNCHNEHTNHHNGHTSHNNGGPINYLEHVELIATIEYPTRGHLELFLSSPTGTTSNLLTYRPRDKAMMGFTDWSFMSVHFWGERAQGTWTLRVRDKHRGQSKIDTGYLVNATLKLHGTTTRPAHMNKARVYEGEHAIKETLQKSIVQVDPATGLQTHDEDPWDPVYFDDMSAAFNEESEDRPAS